MNKNHIKFCQELASGKSQTDSYKSAFKSCKKDETARVNASRLLTKANVFDYYQSLLKQNAESSKVTRDEILSKYKEIYNSSPDGLIIKNSDRLKALELTAKMLGFNEPDKLDVKMTGVQIIAKDTEQASLIAGLKIAD